MSESSPPPELEDGQETGPSVEQIRDWFKGGYSILGNPISEADLDFLFKNADGSLVDQVSAIESAFSWLSCDGQDPKEFGEPGFVEKLAKE